MGSRVNLYDELIKRMSKEELEKSIEEKKEEFAHLITDKVALRLIAKERGIEEGEFVKISQIATIGNEKRVNIMGNVLRFLPSIEYPSGNKVREILVGDETGKIEVAFWNEDRALLKGLALEDRISLKNLYVRKGRLNFSFRSSLIVIKRTEIASVTKAVEIIKQGICPKIVIGNVVEIRDGCVLLSDGSSSLPVWYNVWDERIASIEKESEVVLEGCALYREGLFLREQSRIKIKRKKIEDRG